MKVILVNGSSNEHGCTYTALSEAAKPLNEAGIETEFFWIGRKPMQGCIGCGGCGRKGKCVLSSSLRGAAWITSTST